MASDIRYQILIDGKPDGELTAQLTEIDVNESVRQATSTRVRFVTDVCKADLHLLADQRLQPGVDRLLSVLVSVDGKSIIISHGVIVDRTFEIIEGGPGSWVEVFTTDRRVQMERNCMGIGHLTGNVKAVVEPILKRYKFETDINVKSNTTYTLEKQTLNQTISDLALVRLLAGQAGVEFWIDYTLKGKVKETAHFKPSPLGSQGGPQSLLPALLSVDTATPTLQLNAGSGKATMLNFKAKLVSEAPNQGDPVRVNIDDARVERSKVPEPTVDRLGKKPPAKKNQCQIMSAGDLNEAHRRQTAALNDAAWTMRASAETTVRMVCGLIRPHTVVKVRGVGKIDEGDYFVDSVKHSITQSDHKLSLEMRRNALKTAKEAGVLGLGVGGF
jgi:hypothetical protein